MVVVTVVTVASFVLQSTVVVTLSNFFGSGFTGGADSQSSTSFERSVGTVHVASVPAGNELPFFGVATQVVVPAFSSSSKVQSTSSPRVTAPGASHVAGV